MNGKQQAIEATRDALQVVAQADGDYGPGSPEASGAALAAIHAAARAATAGATGKDIRKR